MLRLPKSIFKSIRVAILNDPEVRRSIASYPRFWRWTGQRFSASDPFGLQLTVGIALSLVFLWFFFSVVEAVLSREALIQADLRLLSLVQMFRSPRLNTVMAFLTYLGNWQIVGGGAALVGLYLAVTRRWRWILAMVVSIAGGEGLVWLSKTGFARQRPDLVNALIPAHGLSFPSGHAFVAISFYGLVAWFAMERAKTWTVRVSVALLALVVILAIGFSRIYLGVHWPSDVLASYALGAAWLSALITTFSVASASSVEAEPYRGSAWTALLAVAFGVIWVSFVAVFNYTHPLVERIADDQKTIDLSADDFPSALLAAVPHFTEDIAGTPLEPINVVLVGSEADLAKAFADAGWEPTDRISIRTSWRMLIAELRNRPPSRAPGLPTFWRGQPNQRGFQRVDPNGSPRERHHLHLWDTAFRVSGDEVWVGTVHYDKQARSAGGTGLLIHQIDPAVDREREALRADLSRTSCILKNAEVSVTEPMQGKNAIGNPFFTDGHAVVVFLRCGRDS